jgi:hypothetical protein
MTSVNPSLRSFHVALDRSINSVAQAGGQPMTAQQLEHLIGGIKNFTLAHRDLIQSALDGAIRGGRITHEQAAQFGQQLKEKLVSAVDAQQLRASTDAAEWLRFQGVADTAISSFVRDSIARAQHATAFTSFNAETVKSYLATAGADGKITLAEVNGMYQGVHEAFRGGHINKDERDNLIKSLDSELKAQAGESRQGACANRAQGDFHRKLTDEAKTFLSSLGVTPTTTPTGRSTYEFDDSNRLQAYVRGITQDGKCTPAERQALFNHVIRDGQATQTELLTLRHALATAARDGVISRSEYRQTLSAFDRQIARYMGGVPADQVARESAIQQTGMFRLRA